MHWNCDIMLFYSHLCSIFDLSIVNKGNSTPILSSSPLIGETFNRMEEHDSSKLPPRKDSRERGAITTLLVDWRQVHKKQQILPLPLSDPLSCLSNNSHHAYNIKTQGNKVSSKWLVYCFPDTKRCCSSVPRGFYHCQPNRYWQMMFYRNFPSLHQPINNQHNRKTRGFKIGVQMQQWASKGHNFWGVRARQFCLLIALEESGRRQHNHQRWTNLSLACYW